EPFLGQLALRDLGRRAEPHDGGYVQSAAAHAALVAAAVDDRGHANAWLAAYPQRSDALRSVELVRADGDQIHLHLLDVEGQLANALHGVAVEQDPLLLADGADLGNRLHRPDLVVREHDRDQDRLVRHRVAHLLRRDAAILIDVEIGDAEALS